MNLPESLAKASEAATRREKKRRLKEKRAKLEALRAATDGFLAVLPATLAKAGMAQYFLDPEKDCYYDRTHKRHVVTKGTAAAYLERKLLKMGLSVEVLFDSDTVGYSVRSSAALVVRYQPTKAVAVLPLKTAA